MLPSNGPGTASTVDGIRCDLRAFETGSTAWYSTNLATEETSRLLDDCQAGKAAAWEDFYARFHALIRITVVKAARPFGCSDRTVFEELVQETYVRLCAANFRILRTARSEHPNAIFALVQSVAWATAVDSFRNRYAAKRGGEVRTVSFDGLLRDVALPQHSPENQLETRLLIEKVEDHLDAFLDEATRDRDKSVFWLHYRQGFTAVEISRIARVGLTPKGVESLLHRIVGELKDKMQRRKRSDGSSSGSQRNQETAADGAAGS